MSKHIVTEADLKKHPEWLKDGIKVGDKIDVEAEKKKEEPEEAEEVAEDPEAEDAPEAEEEPEAPKAKKSKKKVIDVEAEKKKLVLHQVPNNTTGRKDAVPAKNGTLMIYTAKHHGVYYHKGQMYNLAEDIKKVFMEHKLVPVQ